MCYITPSGTNNKVLDLRYEILGSKRMGVAFLRVGVVLLVFSEVLNGGLWEWVWHFLRWVWS